jgi:hypothetical protein
VVSVDTGGCSPTPHCVVLSQAATGSHAESITFGIPLHTWNSGGVAYFGNMTPQPIGGTSANLGYVEYSGLLSTAAYSVGSTCSANGIAGTTYGNAENSTITAINSATALTVNAMTMGEASTPNTGFLVCSPLNAPQNFVVNQGVAGSYVGSLVSKTNVTLGCYGGSCPASGLVELTFATAGDATLLATGQFISTSGFKAVTVNGEHPIMWIDNQHVVLTDTAWLKGASGFGGVAPPGNVSWFDSGSTLFCTGGAARTPPITVFQLATWRLYCDAHNGSTLNAISSGGSVITFPNTNATLAASNITQTWTAPQIFTNSDLCLLGSSTGCTTFTSQNSSSTSYTAYLPPYTGYVMETTTSSPSQGDVAYYNGTNWVNLGAGSAGQFLQTGGGSANPSWASARQAFSLVVDAAAPSAGTYYEPVSGWSDLSPVGYAGANQLFPFGGTFKNLYVLVNTPPGGTDTFQVTLQINGSPSGLSCMITGAATMCNDTTHTATIGANQTAYYAFVQGSGSVAAKPTVGIEFDSP